MRGWAPHFPLICATHMGLSMSWAGSSAKGVAVGWRSGSDRVPHLLAGWFPFLHLASTSDCEGNGLGRHTGIPGAGAGWWAAGWPGSCLAAPSLIWRPFSQEPRWHVAYR